VGLALGGARLQGPQGGDASSSAERTRGPECWELLGLEQPSWSDLGLRGAESGWPIHAKDLGDKDKRIDFDKLEHLPVAHAETSKIWRQERRWLEDDDMYKDVPVKGADGAPGARLKSEWVERLEEVHVIRKIPRNQVRGWVKMFAVPEVRKQRFRPIKFTQNINEVLDKSTLRKVGFPSKQDICGFVYQGEWMLAFDFAAYYDQFILDRVIGRRSCFRHGKDYYCLNTLAMGQRQAVEIAEAATGVLIDFKRKSKVARSIIDNVIFVGTRDQVIADGKEFVRMNPSLEHCHLCFFSASFFVSFF